MIPATRLPRGLSIPALFLCLLLAGVPASAATMRGTVFDAKQQPLPGVTLTLAAGSGKARAVETDAEGRYEFPDLTTGHYAVVARKVGFASQRQTVTVVRANQLLGIYFRLQPWAAAPWSVTGTVLREDGKAPLAGAEVHLERECLPRNMRHAGGIPTGETGFFAFTGLKPGHYRLSVFATDYLSYRGEEIHLREGADRHSRDITLQPPPPHTIAGTVTGQALDDAGRPLARKEARLRMEGSSVSTWDNWGETLRRPSVELHSGESVEEHRLSVRASVPTDDGGKFRFTFPPGTYTLKLWTEGFLSKTQSVKVEPDRECPPLTFRLMPGEEPVSTEGPPRPRPSAPPQGTIRVQVLLPDETPLASTGIYVFTATLSGDASRPWEGGTYAGLSQSYLVTDGDGRFVKRDIPAGPTLVAVKTRGFTETEAVRVEVPEEGEAGFVVLLQEPPVQVSGRVTDADGKPLAGARVYAYRVLGTGQDDHFWNALSIGWWGQGDAGPWPFDARVEDLKPGVVPGLLRHGTTYAETDAEGRFALKELDTGVHHFGATAPGWSRESREKVTLRAGSPTPDLAFALRQLGSIEGVVLHPEGRPLGPGQVAIRRTETTNLGTAAYSQAVALDAAGRYRLPEVEPGTYRLELIARGFPRVQRDRVVVLPGESTPGTDFRLETGCALRGRVLQPDGAPAQSALVHWRHDPPRPMDDLMTRTGADGSFELKGLEAGAGIVQAWMEGLTPSAREMTIPLAKDAAIELRLDALLAVRGIVRDMAGKPIEGAQLSWRPEASAGRETYVEIGPPAQTDAAGAYLLIRVPKRKVRITASKEGYRSAYVLCDPTAQEGEPTADVTLEGLRYGRLRGRVLRPDGTPAPGIRLRIWTVSAPTQAAVTDTEGRFVCERSPTGTVSLSLEGQVTRSMRPVEVREGAETVVPDVRIAATGTLEGRITGLHRLPPGGRSSIHFRMEPAAGAEPVAPEGDWLHLYLAQPESGTKGESTPAVRRAAARPRWFSGMAVGSTWIPRPREETGGTTQLQTEGTFRIERAVAGTGHVALSAYSSSAGYVSYALAPAKVTEGGTTRVEAVVPPGGSLSGRIRRPAGVPASDRSTMTLVESKTLQPTALLRIGPDGDFSLDGIPAGDYLAMVWEPGLAGMKRAVTIRAAETTALKLDLVPGVALRGKVEGKRPGELYVSAEGDESFGGVQVNEDGTFAIDHLLPGAHALRLWTQEGPKVGKARQVDVGDGGTEGVVLTWE